MCRRRYLSIEALENAREVLATRTTDNHSKEVTTVPIAGTIHA